MSSQVNDVFNAFVEAQKAMQRLPEAEAELARAKGELSVTYNRLNDAWAKQDTLNDRIAVQAADLSAKEAALSEATFREGQLRDQLALLVSTFKSVIGEAASAVELVEPKPVPVAEVMPVANETSGGTSESVSVSSDPIQADSTTGSTTRSEASVASETDLPGTFQAGSGFSHWNDGFDNAPRLTEAAREPETNPTSTSNTAQNSVEASTPSISDTPTTSPSGADSTQGNFPRQYWEKPSNVTWYDWRASGGELAPWCRHSSDEQLRNIFN